MTALHWAIRRGHVDVATCLIARKADPTVQNNLGMNAMDSAVMYLDYKIALYLKEKC